MSKYAYIAYNKRSATTGKALFEAFKKQGIGGFIWRFCTDSQPAKKPDLVVRWGNSYLDIPGVLEINTKEAVQKAADKGKMSEILSARQGVVFPEMVKPGMPLNNGPYFIRNRHDQINYRSNWLDGDKYAVKEVNKAREYRVHVFNDVILGVYQKVPRNAGDKIFKAENCDFKRIDLGNREATAALKGVRPMAKEAVKALGLVYGGVDAIIDNNGRVYILEVNSSPALNTLNIDRWAQAFDDFIAKRPKSAKAEAREEEQAAVNPAEERRMAAEQQRRAAEEQAAAQRRAEEERQQRVLARARQRDAAVQEAREILRRAGIITELPVWQNDGRAVISSMALVDGQAVA